MPVFLGIILSSGPAFGSAPADRIRVLTHASEVGKLSIDEANREYPVVLHGVVTYAVSKLGLAFVHDSTGGAFVYFDYTSAVPELHTGQRVEVRGVTTPGNFSPCLKKGQFKVLGEAALPRPLRKSFEQLITGRWACEWIELEGTIRSGRELPGSVQMNLAVENGKVLLIMQKFPDWQQVLVGTKVRIRGAVSNLYNDQRQGRGVKIFVPGLQYVSILKAAPADRFSLPLNSLGLIGQYDVVSDLDAPMRVRGSVTGVEAGHRIYVSNGETSVAVQAFPACSPHPGDLIDVIGYRELVDRRPGLVDAICRVVPGALKITPVVVNAKEIVALKASPNGDPTVFLHTSTRYDLRLVQVEGTLLQRSSGPEGLTLILDSPGGNFTATFPKVSGVPNLGAQAGSRLRLTGVCVITYDSFSLPLGFRMILREPADIVVLSQPSWWTLGRLWGLLGAALTAGLIAVGWIFLLRARVEERTTALKQANDHLFRLSSLDGLTEIANRRMFDQTLEKEWLRMLRNELPLSLILIDIDHFKLLNDRLGHQRGDECLILIASELRNLIQRETDLVARFGGEEFAVILSATTGEAAGRVAEAIRRGVARLQFEHPMSPIAANVTLSLGLATAVPHVFKSAKEFVAATDKALYTAKHRGRDRVVCFTSIEASEINPGESTEPAGELMSLPYGS